MERHLDIDIGQIKDDLSKMAGLVELAIDKSIRSLKDRNLDLAQEVIDEDAAIDSLEIKVENSCLRVLARQQPVAADLRFIMACIKVYNDLERMGDHAVNIAQKAQELAKGSQLKPLIDIPYMADIVQKMLRESLDSFFKLDAVKAKEVCENDDVVDSLDTQIQRELLTYMMEDHKNISKAFALSMISKNLERIADLSTNIGEETIFIAEAKTIKHHFSDSEKDS